MQNLEKHVNFENENSRKAYFREFKKVLNHELIKLNQDPTKTFLITFALAYEYLKMLIVIVTCH